jgi:hypothetical protein
MNGKLNSGRRGRLEEDAGVYNDVYTWVQHFCMQRERYPVVMEDLHLLISRR